MIITIDQDGIIHIYFFFELLEDTGRGGGGGGGSGGNGGSGIIIIRYKI